MSNSKIYKEDGIKFELVKKVNNKAEAKKLAIDFNKEGYYSRVRHFYDKNNKIICYGVLKSFMQKRKKGKKREEPIVLNPVLEYTNICNRCGAENTLYPYFMGKKVLHKCERCGEFVRGITKKKWNELKEKRKIIDKKQKEIFKKIKYKNNYKNYEISVEYASGCVVGFHLVKKVNKYYQYFGNFNDRYDVAEFISKKEEGIKVKRKAKKMSEYDWDVEKQLNEMGKKYD